MQLHELSLANVRSYELFSARFDERVTLILGNNGTGKTSLLEGVYYLLQGTSFRGRDRDMIAHTSTRADLLLTLSDDTKRRATLQVQDDGKIKKNFTCEDSTSVRLPAKYRQAVVLFEPDELRLISSSPDRRRRFFDAILCRLYPQYATILSRYQRTLLQRNELLKQREVTDEVQWNDHLFAWDIKFVELAQIIVQMRREFVVTSNSNLSRLYSSMAKNDHKVTVSYHCTTPMDDYQHYLLRTLESTRVADSYRGYTSVGPHRDDFIVQLDGHPAASTASRGEMRTIMLSYKLLEVELSRELYAQNPIILMDDVFSELDTTREQQLMHALEPYQTIITATDLRDHLKINASIVSLTP